MKNPSGLIHHLCGLTATLLSCVGLISAHLWAIAIPAAILGLSGFLPRVWQKKLAGPLQLAGWVLVTAAGLLLGASPYLLITSFVFALASWELEDLFLEDHTSTILPSMRIFHNNHLKWLGIFALISILICGASLLLRVKISFGIMALIVVLILYACFQLIRLIRMYYEK